MLGSSISMESVTLLDDAPVNAETAKGITSNWAYDHAADIDAHIRDPFESILIGQYDPGGHWGGFSTQATAQNRFIAIPFNVSRNRTYDFAAISIGTAVANYVTGTAAFTNGSAAVVGTDTTFASTHVGARIKNNTDAVWHVIASVEDATHLTLTANYSSTGGAAAAYTINHRARLGIYADGGAVLPTTLIEDWGEIGLETTSIIQVDITDRSLTKGLYWLVVHSQAAATFKTWTVGSYSPIGLRNSGSAGLIAFEGGYYTDARSYQALPAAAPAFSALASLHAPVIALRVKSND